MVFVNVYYIARQDNRNAITRLGDLTRQGTLQRSPSSSITEHVPRVPSPWSVLVNEANEARGTLTIWTDNYHPCWMESFVFVTKTVW